MLIISYTILFFKIFSFGLKHEKFMPELRFSGRLTKMVDRANEAQR